MPIFTQTFILIAHYYKILGLKEGATKSQIKKAYYQKAKLFHPDVNNSLNAQENFVKINEAFRVLHNGEVKPISKTRPKSNGSYSRMKDDMRRENYRKKYGNRNWFEEEIENPYNQRGYAYKFKNSLFSEEYDEFGRLICYLFFLLLFLFGTFLTVLPFAVFFFIEEQFSVIPSIMALGMGIFVLRFAKDWYVDMKHDFA